MQNHRESHCYHAKKFVFNIQTAELDFTFAKVEIYGVSDNYCCKIASFKTNKSHFKDCLAEYPFYLIVISICGSELMNIFKSENHQIVISEQTTVATTFAFAQFLKVHCCIKLIGTCRQLNLALGMRDNFISASGNISNVIQLSPNGLETNSWALFNFLSGLIYYTITDCSIKKQFLELTSSNRVLKGLLTIALNPNNNVKAIYDLTSKKSQPFYPSLPGLFLPPSISPIPNQWTMTIKINNSGATNFPPGGPGYVVFDKNNRAWAANNSTQATPNSANFGLVFNSNGKPASFSPLWGGGIIGSGFGVAVNRDGDTIAFGNYGWGPMQYNPQKGSVSIFNSKGKVQCPPQGFTNGLSRVQGLLYDRHDNLWMASWGTQKPMNAADGSIFDFVGEQSAIVVYLKGDPNKMLKYSFPSEFYQTFDMAFDEDDHVYVSNSGNVENNIKSTVYKLKFTGNSIELVKFWTGGFDTLRQIRFHNDHIYVGAVSSDRIIKFNRDLIPVNTFTVNIHGPWGFTFDANNTIFVSNFWREDIEKLGLFSVTVIHDEKDNNNQIFTLPTGGEQVTLSNGQALYGNAGIKSFEPLMRSTGNAIDGAGNLWVVNNWKPSFYIDMKDNPGGDGIVIFVGVAAPN